MKNWPSHNRSVCLVGSQGLYQTSCECLFTLLNRAKASNSNFDAIFDAFYG